ncbi:nitric oxide dioxygenase [Schizosaccharomyces cryophilus OY26]|uniref:nitric oxide dioxygenase n=1 Tax=Schizosaccharomyces cryophilus (strain OY26 / ATCC MYA-4695 / CBS 11777 / NBRC 106824 / NRRL Y48691) TaxID=653667 RepID=S9X8F9_SCHCR|nr:nitric oxide dioxygenase [Schizosaccharomyces cryophilus OY26]EPY50116.1 nitric oxide dioxygenase [Schizosaccharomyces cryophilus OY26]
MSAVQIGRDGISITATSDTRLPVNEYHLKEMNDSQKQYIRSSIPILESSGVNITQAFYQRMLENYPEVRPYFNKAHQISLSQPRILAFALLNYARNIDDLTPLSEFIDQIIVKHIGLQIKAEHYPIVGQCLLATMREMLGEDVATPEFLEAWTIAYGNLAKILIDAEKNIYQSQPWNGFAEFEVVDLIDESFDVKSVYMVPRDKTFKIASAYPGQYISISWKIPGLPHETIREYSLSKYPDTKKNQYRISVRRVHEGIVSNYVHEHLKVGDIVGVSPPAGKRKPPVLCFAGGIGITPIVPIVENALLDGRTVVFCYSNRNYSSRPFKNWLLQLKDQYKERFKLKEFFSKEAYLRKEEIIDELMTRVLLREDIMKLNSAECDIYMLGPNSYMRFVKEELVKLGVEPKRIATEFFGPYSP